MIRNFQKFLTNALSKCYFINHFLRLFRFQTSICRQLVVTFSVAANGCHSREGWGMQKRRMYLNCFFAVAMCLGLAFALLPTAYGQETTGGIKGYVKDRSGATVAKAQVELSGP